MTKTANYNRKPYDFGDLMTVEEFKEAVKLGSFTDYDGCGQPCRNGMMSIMVIMPSTIEEIPEDATHIQWFNK